MHASITVIWNFCTRSCYRNVTRRWVNHRPLRGQCHFVVVCQGSRIQTPWPTSGPFSQVYFLFPSFDFVHYYPIDPSSLSHSSHFNVGPVLYLLPPFSLPVVPSLTLRKEEVCLCPSQPNYSVFRPLSSSSLVFNPDISLSAPTMETLSREYSAMLFVPEMLLPLTLFPPLARLQTAI